MLKRAPKHIVEQEKTNYSNLQNDIKKISLNNKKFIMTKFNKKKLPSRHTSLGPEKAGQRSFYYAMNLTEKDIAKPFVGVVTTWNEAAPCNIALMRQAQSVKKGVKLTRRNSKRILHNYCNRWYCNGS